MALIDSNLIWIDLEMTGLEPQQDQIIEIATVVTDLNLEVLAQGPVIALHQSDTVLGKMDEWNTRHHGDSGLTQRVRESLVTAADAERKNYRLPETICACRKVADVWQ